MLKKQYENTFSNWLTRRQSFLSDKNESIRANEEEEEKKEGQQNRPTFRHQSPTLINETPKLRHWLAARNVGSRDPSGNFLPLPSSKNPPFQNEANLSAQHKFYLHENSVSVSTLSSAEVPAGYPYKNSNNLRNRKHAGDDGKREKAGKGISSLFPLPIVPLALSFSFSPAS